MKMCKAFVTAAMLHLLLVGMGLAQELKIPEAKQTVLELYVTSTEAYEKWKADPEHVKLIDVRTPEEYVFVGHPHMAWNVPLKFLAYQWDAEAGKSVMTVNPDFVAEVKRLVKATDTLLVTCRSGQRSGPAVNLLAEAGLCNVYSIIDGVEGDKVNDLDSVFNGKRMKNGWKNSGLPWTYKLDPRLMYLQKSSE